MTPKLVLFDLDGTLVDTAPDFVLAANALRRDKSLAPLPAETISRVVSNGSIAVTEVALETTREHEDFEDQRQALLKHYSSFLGSQSEIYPTLNSTLQQLESACKPWGIVTNKPIAYADPLLHTLGLTINQRCSALICPDHVKQPKPDPEGIFKACEQTGFETSDCIFVGDHLRDIEAAKLAGANSIAVSYGYLAINDNPHEWGADHIVERPEELSELLLDLLI